MNDPKTRTEWQQVVDLAYALRHDQYGIANVERCDALLSRGKSMGIIPVVVRDGRLAN